MLNTALSIFQIFLLLAIVILLARQAAGPRVRLAMPGVVPGPMAWELKRLQSQIDSLLNWGNN